MSRLSVRNFMATTAESAAANVKTYTDWTLSVQSEPPVLAKMGSLLVVVIGPMRMKESRFTPPRIGVAAAPGQKVREYQVAVQLFAEGKVASVQDEFATAEELLAAAYASCLLPYDATDPVTGAQSQILTVGEDIDTVEADPESLATVGRFRMSAELVVTAVEFINS